MNYNGDVGQDVGQGVGQDVAQEKDTKDQIIAIINENNKTTKKRIGELLGVSEKTIERVMKDMPNVVFVGSGYSGHWEIKE